MVLDVLYVIFLAAAIIQTVYYLLVFTPILLPKERTKVSNSSMIPLSVVICAKNEAKNLFSNLPKILSQQYDNYEVIVIDDGSKDETWNILAAFSKDYANLRVFQFSPEMKKGVGKKEALAFGIQQTRSEWVVLTDADCEPATNQWLEKMSVGMLASKEIVLGIGLYETEASFVNMLARYETILVAIQYLNFCHIGLPYMGVGRNIAYKKSLFQQDINMHDDLSSGDDDLFVNAVATSKNCTYVLDRKSFTYSKAPADFRSWLIQKQRHYATGIRYKKIHQFLLGLFLATKWLFWITFFLLWCYSGWEIVHKAFSGTIFAIYLLNVWMAAKTKERYFWMMAPVLDLVYIMIAVPLGLKSSWWPTKRWK